MRILLTNAFYYPAFDGGAEVSVKLLADGLANNGNQVYVLTTGKSSNVYRVGKVIVISLKQRNIFNSYKKGKIPTVLKMIWHLIDSCNPFYHYQISAILKRITPQVVHTNTIQGFSPFLWYTVKKHKIPLVHSMRDYYMLCFKCNMFNGEMRNCEKLCTACNVTHTIKRSFFKYPDFFVGVSNFVLNKYKEYVQIDNNRSAVIYNAVAADDNLTTKEREDKSKVRLGYIGRLAKDKGVLYMADELAKLSEQHKAMISITFAGQGEDTFIDVLKSKLKGINVEFLGLVNSSTFYQTIDVLVVPALWNEPFGRIVIESLLAGVPVCQSDRGGLQELYNPETSWMFSPVQGNLTDVISHILNNTQEIAVKKAKAKEGYNAFSERQHVGQYFELYNNLLTNYKPNTKESSAGDRPALLLTKL